MKLHYSLKNCYICVMSSNHNTYPEKVAKAIVDKAIVHGMPVTKVAHMYDLAKDYAKGAVAGRTDRDSRQYRAAYFTCLRNMLESGCRKYAAKIKDSDRQEIREILTRNHDKLIKEWASGTEKGKGTAPGAAEEN